MEETSAYSRAGVDLEKAVAAKARIRQMARSTFTPGVLTEIGTFGGHYTLEGLPSEELVLVSSADGVGTKLKLAFATGTHRTVGRDLVAHCINDILTQGARPLFFLDYIAVGKLENEVVEQVVAGLSAECLENRCALIGGETAQMPDFYREGEYDLAGFIVGWVRKSRTLGPSRVKEGDALLGIASSGLHTNGYSLARKILLEQAGLALNQAFPGSNTSVAEELLKVHRCYLRLLEPLLDNDSLHAMAHITGGGITENLPRLLPDGLSARIRLGSWPVLEIFGALQRLGGISDQEMFRVFNMGIGMILVVAQEQAEAISAALNASGEPVYRLGEVVAGNGDVRYITA